MPPAMPPAMPPTIPPVMPPSYGAPPAPGAFPAAASYGTPLSSGQWSPVLGIAATVAATAVISALYGLILAESRHAISYILIIGGIVAGILLGKTALPPVVRGAVGAVLVGGFGFAAIVYGSFGQLAKQASAATGEHISFGTAVKQATLHDALSLVTSSIWAFYSFAIVISFVYGLNGGMARYRRR
jgi:hypothetical protein